MSAARSADPADAEPMGAGFAPPPPLYPSAGIAWFGMAAFFLAQIVATMDRGLLAFVVDPVRRDLGISDVQISLLQGLAFAIFYATVGLPLGMIADVVSRRRLLIAGILVWSVATLASGFAHGFGQMFACRLLVGLGEATLGPCAISMIGDLFPPSRRARPMSVYLLGGTISGGMAILMTGQMMNLSPATRALIPYVGGMAPWRLTFMICGLLGLINAVMLIALPEVKRMGRLLDRRGGLGIGAVWGYFARHWQVFLPLYIGAGLWTTGSGSVASWSVPFMTRHFGVSLPFVGQRLGSINMVLAVIGSFGASFVLEAARRCGGVRGKLALAPWLPLLGLPATMIALSPNVLGALLLAGVPTLVLTFYGSNMLSALSDLVPADMRGIAVALYAFSGTMIGATLGPLLVAFCTEHLLGGPALVGWAILIVGAPAMVLSSLMFVLAGRGLAYRTAIDPTMAETVLASQI